VRGAVRPLAVANHRPGLQADRRAVAAAVAVLDAHAGAFRGGCPPGELSVVFLSDPALAKLHADFLADPTPTDVITFAGDPAHQSAGEICVSADAAARVAGRGAAAYSDELTLYLVHGWLHLAGYDDLRVPAKRAMRRAEARALRLLRAAGAMPRFKLA
jgi:probable rRNA maturation factor